MSESNAPLNTFGLTGGELDTVGTDDVMESLPISLEKMHALLSDLRRRSGRQVERDQRQFPRYRFEEPMKLVAQVQHSGGTVGHYLAQARNLSSGGIGFLHGNRLPAGTRCNIVLLQHDGEVVSIPGRVRHCTLVHDTIHEVGIEFDQPIELDSILGAARETA